MNTYTVTVHLPRVGSPDERPLVGVITGSGAVEHFRLPASTDTGELRSWAELFILKRYPATVAKMHGSRVVYTTDAPKNSSMLVVIEVDCED